MLPCKILFISHFFHDFESISGFEFQEGSKDVEKLVCCNAIMYLREKKKRRTLVLSVGLQISQLNSPTYKIDIPKVYL